MVRYLKRGADHLRQPDDSVGTRVKDMLAQIRRDGEDAVRDMSVELDAWAPSSFKIRPEVVLSARDQIPPDLLGHLTRAAERIRRFAEEQVSTVRDMEIELEAGFVAGHRHIPVDSVGAYVAGGRYQLVSSALMSVIPAKVAGVPRVVAVVGPRHGVGPSPSTLVAADLAGADEIWCLGGVQALGSLAYGCLPELPAVDMIVGAGNDYVAEAKRQLFGTVGIDLLAGPSEVVIIADGTADADTVAVDLLAQAEHGPTSPSLLITTDEDLAQSVLRAVETPLSTWSTSEVAEAAWRTFGTVAVVESREEAVALSDAFAGEHVHLMVSEPEFFEGRLRNYGCLFVGHSATVAFGDKAAGPNHTLPTQSAARYTGGLSALKFLKTVTYQRFGESGGAALVADTAAIARAEGMVGHVAAAELRAESTVVA